MKIMDKTQLEKTIGKASFWLPKRTVTIGNYISGIESFDVIDKTSTIPNIIDFQVHKDGLAFILMKKYKSYKTGIVFNKIISINLEDKEQIFENKEKSVIGRAIVGGFLLGPLGAIVGGMSGVKDGTKKMKMPDLILSIEIGNNSEVENVLTFGIPYKKKKDIQAFFLMYLKKKFNFQF